MSASKTKSLHNKGEFSSRSSQSIQKRTIRKFSAKPTRRSGRIRSKMEEELQANQNNERDDCQPAEAHHEEKTMQEKINEMYLTLRSLREENRRLTGEYGAWAMYHCGSWGKYIRFIENEMYSWALNYAHKHTKDLDCLSKEQKRQIISMLDGYCVQEDFDSIVSRIPHSITDMIPVPALFVKLLLIKDVFTRCFENPFWYLSANPESHDYREESEEINTPFGKELGSLYKRFLETNQVYARIWRQATVRMSNATAWERAPDPEFGKQIHRHRDALVELAVSKLLSDKTFQCLLRAPEDSTDESDRKEDLLNGYQEAAHTSGYLFTQHESLEIWGLSEIAPKFDHKSEVMKADFHHFLKEGSTRLDGHPVLMLSRPLVVHCGDWFDNDKQGVAMKADVIMEDKCDSEKVEKAVEPKED